MSNTVAPESWVLCSWAGELDPQWVHKDDINRFARLVPHCRVFARIGTEQEYAVLQFGDETFRVKPALMEAVPAPAFAFGQRVHINGKDLIGVVAEIIWHHGRGEPFFHLRANNKRLTKRYWKEDLSSAE